MERTGRKEMIPSPALPRERKGVHTGDDLSNSYSGHRVGAFGSRLPAPPLSSAPQSTVMVVAPSILLGLSYLLTIAAHLLPLVEVSIRTDDLYRGSTFTVTLWLLQDEPPLPAPLRRAQRHHHIHFAAKRHARVCERLRILLCLALVLPVVAACVAGGLAYHGGLTSVRTAAAFFLSSLAASIKRTCGGGGGGAAAADVEMSESGLPAFLQQLLSPSEESDGKQRGMHRGNGRLAFLLLRLRQIARRLRRTWQDPDFWQQQQRCHPVHLAFFVALVLLMLAMVVVLQLAVARGAGYLTGHGLAADLEDVFVVLLMPLDGEDITRFSVRRLRSGYACIVASFVSTATAVALLADGNGWLMQWCRCERREEGTGGPLMARQGPSSLREFPSERRMDEEGFV